MPSRSERNRRKRARKQNMIRRLVIGTSVVLIVAALAIIGWRLGGLDAARPDLPEPAGKKQQQTAPSGSGQSAQPTATPADSAPDGNANRARLVFVGDVMLGGKVEGLLKQFGADYPYQDVRSLLNGQAIAVANLETPITNAMHPEQKQYVYKTSAEVIPAFREAGFDLVNLANNHVMDYGREGLLDTFDALQQNGIRYVGAGHNAAEAYQPQILENNGIKVAFLGFSRVVPEVDWKAEKQKSGVAETYDYRKPVDAIKQAKDQADLVVVLAHWGVERKDTPENYQIELAHRYIDAGADLVIGSHPHVLQSLEHYKGKWIAYSLGNFIFTTNENPRTWETVIAQVSCSKAGDCDMQLVPVLTKWAKPVVLQGEDGENLLARLAEISENVRIGTNGAVEKR